MGGWDERWLRNQDAEMAARFLEQGSILVCLPEMTARYLSRDRISDLGRQWGGYGFYRAATAGRHPTSLARSKLISPLLVCCVIAATAAPRPLRRLARVPVGAYLAITLGVGASAARTVPLSVAATVPPALFAMHLGWGVGFICGARRFGVPWAALAHAVGVGTLERRIGPTSNDPVYAPSLASS